MSSSNQYYLREEDPEPILSQLVRRAEMGTLVKIDTLPPLQNTALPPNRVILRGYEWRRDEADEKILRIYDMDLNAHPVNEELEDLFLRKLPNAAILIFDANDHDRVIKIPRAHRYPGPYVFELVQIKHRDNYRIDSQYVKENLDYSAQYFDDESNFAPVVLCGEISTKNQHPVHSLLIGADQNPKIGIKFHDNLHKPDFPASLDYPTFNRDKYPCGLRWNCPMEVEALFIHTLDKFQELVDRGRKTNIFQVGEPADSERNWDVDEQTEIEDMMETIEITNLTLMTAAIAADQDRIMKIKDPKLLEIERQRIQALKEQIAT